MDIHPNSTGERPPPLKFETLHIVLNFLGSTFFVLAGILLLPLLCALLSGEIHDLQIVKAFLYPFILSVLLGILLRHSFHQGTPGTLQAMLICSLGWIGFSAVGALPFVFGIDATFLDSFFEAMSGFTTTGITLLTGLDEMPKTILFWRSFTQWLGGIGILTFFLVVSYRGKRIHHLFGAESHKIKTSRPVPGLANTVKILYTIYVGFTFVIAAALFLAGMNPFDSVCHSFTALSTGGFSPHDASIGYYKMAGYPHVIIMEYILIAGMVLGGINFLVHYRVLNRNIKSLWDNTEMRYFWGFIAAFSVLIFVERILSVPLTGNPGIWIQVEENFRIVIFQVVSIMTTTGFGTQDIGSPFFGGVARQLFLVMMFTGGCVGSTGGGFKVLRIAILGKLIGREVYRSRAPRQAISTLIVDGKPVDMDEIQRVSGLFFAWIALILCGGVITAFLSHYNGYVSFSGMFSAVGNIGPSYIPVAEMALLNPVVKIVYIFGMLAGRLEILPVLLLFSVRAWYPKNVRRD
ncbi:MAG: TrkH family potassium uptake protein [Theionarchaea archaeon]|nr:TrkH family potassium uptake protein [Theionarchaea archaeon]